MADPLEWEWYSYFTQLDEAEKKSILQILKTFLHHRNKDKGNTSIDQYNKEIEEARVESAVGNYITQDEMEKRAAKW